MAKVKRVLRCNKCGVILQGLDPDKKGYIPTRILERENLSTHVLYCDDCFEEVKLLNASSLDNNINEQTLRILDDAVATDALIIWVVDSFSFVGSFKADLVKKIKGLKLVVLVTKFDLFPQSVKKDHLEQYVKDRFNEVGLEPLTIKILDTLDSYNSEETLEPLHEIRRGHDVFMIGTTMSGKTTIINSAMKIFNNKTRWNIKTEAYQGTNLKVLEIPLSNSSFFYELPGLSLDNSTISKVEKEVQKLIIPHKKIKVTPIALKPGDGVMAGGICSLELIEGEPTTFKAYTSEAIEFKKAPTNKMNDIFKDNLRKRLVRPVSDQLLNFVDFDVFQYEMDNDNQYHDIGIEGFGWFTFLAKGQIVRITLPHKVALKECLSKVQ
ncbi:MAG: hypothetical protein ACI31G_01690 [Bacilli bacterium]